MELSNYNIYTNKDGRMRAYDKTTKKVVSYPRLVAEQAFGIKLKKTEDVHHKDGNPLNNSPDNLEIIDHIEHDIMHGKTQRQKKYFDKTMICPTCEKEFLWTVGQQRNFMRKDKIEKRENNNPFCSLSCAMQYKYKSLAEKGYKKVKEKVLICPVCKNEFVWSKASQYRYLKNEVELKTTCCSLKCRHAYRRTTKENLEEVQEIQNLLKENNGNITKTAKTLNKTRGYITRKLKGLGLPYHSVDYAN